MGSMSKLAYAYLLRFEVQNHCQCRTTMYGQSNAPSYC